MPLLTLKSITPSHGATNIPTNVGIVITFSESIQFVSDNNNVVQLKDGAGNVVETSNKASGRLTISNNSGSPGAIHYNPGITLANSTTYSVVILPNSVSKADGRGTFIPTTAVHSFTTQSTASEGPKVVSINAGFVKLTETAPATTPVDVVITVVYDRPCVRRSSYFYIISSGNKEQSFSPTSSRVVVAGNTATITPEPLLHNTIYSIDVSQLVKDLTGKLAVVDNYRFKTTVSTDVTQPQVTSTLPTSNATGVALNNNITVTYNENIVKGTSGSVTIYSGEVAVETIPVADTKLSVSGTTLQINPSATLLPNKNYTITVQAGVVKDITAGNLCNAYSFSFTTGTSSNTTPPRKTFATPSATDSAPPNVQPVVTYNEPIYAGNGFIYFYESGVTSTIVNDLSIRIPEDRNNFIINGTTVTIIPKRALNAGPLKILINGGVFVNSANIGTREEVQFSVGGVGTTPTPVTPVGTNPGTPPAMVSINPVNGATGVSLTSTFNIKFNRTIAKTTTGGKFITLKTSNGVTVETYDAATNQCLTILGDTLVIDPTVTMLPNKGYNIQVGEGCIKDLYGNTNTSFNFGFTTLNDTTPPVISSTSPSGTNAATNSRIVLTFSKPVVAGKGIIYLKVGGSTVQSFNVTSLTFTGNTLSITPTLLPSTAYTVQYDADVIRDISLNPAAAHSFTFTTGTATTADKPVISSTNPVHLATNVPVTGNISLTFNKPIFKGVAGKYIALMSGGVVSKSYEVANSEFVSVSGSTLTLRVPLNALDNSKTYTVQLAADSVVDASGNGNERIMSGYSFTTAPRTTTPAPIITTPSINTAPPSGGGTTVSTGNVPSTGGTTSVAPSGNYNSPVKPRPADAPIDKVTSTTTKVAGVISTKIIDEVPPSTPIGKGKTITHTATYTCLPTIIGSTSSNYEVSEFAPYEITYIFPFEVSAVSIEPAEYATGIEIVYYPDDLFKVTLKNPYAEDIFDRAISYVSEPEREYLTTTRFNLLPEIYRALFKFVGCGNLILVLNIIPSPVNIEDVPTPVEGEAEPQYTLTIRANHDEATNKMIYYTTKGMY